MKRDKREISIVCSSTAEYLKEETHTSSDSDNLSARTASSDQNRTQVRR